jgi:hypothetical protein
MVKGFGNWQKKFYFIHGLQKFLAKKKFQENFRENEYFRKNLQNVM